MLMSVIIRKKGLKLMAIAYGCILIAIILPLLWASVAKSPAFKDKSFDNSKPRLVLAALEGRAQRANWAQQNAFEALPGFIGAVLIAIVAGVSATLINTLAVIFIVARIAHGLCYISDQATARSLVWSVGLACVVALIVLAMGQ